MDFLGSKNEWECILDILSGLEKEQKNVINITAILISLLKTLGLEFSQGFRSNEYVAILL